MTSFTDEAWVESSGIYRRILEMPFIRELTAGTLSRDRFRFYILQDALYLEQFSRALSMASAQAPDTDAMQFFARAAEQAIVVERALHGGYFETFGIELEQAAAAKPSPTCLGYTNYLLAIGLQGGYEDLVAAVLPCFWIYWKAGNRIAGEARPDNPYRAWIDTYADPAFGEAVAALTGIVDRTAAAATERRRDAMRAAFRRAVQYEWMFWDSAYRLEDWPVAP